jgi:peptidoglycan/xylan/chitin deacetylase (PgdA/CDA1 family)
VNQSRLRVLTYHRVTPVDRGTIPSSVVSATPETFREQMSYLARHYRVISVRQVIEVLEGNARLPARAVVITFDDAYRDFGEVAWPILRRLGLPATLFVPTGFVDGPKGEFWWDRLHRSVVHSRQKELRGFTEAPLMLRDDRERRQSLRVLRRLVKSLPPAAAIKLVDEICGALTPEGGRGGATPTRVLGWDELQGLVRDGLDIGGHTRTHPFLPHLSASELHDEIGGCRLDLERGLGPDVPPVFAYPFGAHDAAVVRAAGREGFRLAFTCREGQNDLSRDDPLRLRRTGITLRTTPGLFRLRLSRWFSHLDRWRHARSATGLVAGLRSGLPRRRRMPA